MAFLRSVVIGAVLVACVAYAVADSNVIEVQSLDPPTDASNMLGEAAGRRGGAFLSTTGSFTLGSSSNTAGNDEALVRLGDDEDAEGRRRRKKGKRRKDDKKQETSSCVKTPETIKTCWPPYGWTPNSTNSTNSTWAGAFNQTSAVANPEGEIIPVEKGKVSCKNILRIKKANGATLDKSIRCSSCHDNVPGIGETAFLMKLFKSKTGMCMPYDVEPVVRCAALDKDDSPGPEDKDVLCTKVLLARQIVRYDKLKDKKLKDHLKVLAKSNDSKVKKEKLKRVPKGGYLIAHCNVRKESICRKGKCDVQKQVKCVKVCTCVKARPLEVLKKCIGCGDHGPVLCVRAAMME